MDSKVYISGGTQINIFNSYVYTFLRKHFLLLNEKLVIIYVTSSYNYLPQKKNDRENRSFNESSSTANRPAGLEGRAEPEPVGTSGFKPDPVPSDSKPASEDSYNDSSNTVAAKHAAAAAKVSREKKGGELAGLRDSTEGSKDGVKESSDVQSSASLTRKRRREKEVSGGGKPVVSPATIKREGVKSEPLVGLLDIIRSHKHGSMFERRLEYQVNIQYYCRSIFQSASVYRDLICTVDRFCG